MIFIYFPIIFTIVQVWFSSETLYEFLKKKNHCFGKKNVQRMRPEQGIKTPKQVDKTNKMAGILTSQSH